MNVATMTKDGEVYHMKMAVQPTEILVNFDDWKHNRLIFLSANKFVIDTFVSFVRLLIFPFSSTDILDSPGFRCLLSAYTSLARVAYSSE
ncbi:hypothetical protein B9Z55_026344 [Caenorhabditis nigoni]|uniref:Uncharacterized protein n=1 Tax=Caenorhabditis nigoni TaxID=1611254 RepID=A0A2G5T2V9_9PELO|nr:hypothetical protein B9Z55_026344 [Caenorhabditis nigoni]